MVKNKKGAMELSIGTIVVLVLAMVMLIGGLVLVKTIFDSATSAVGEIDKGVRDSIAKSFTDSSKKLAIYPSARTIEIKQKTQGEGFAFSVRNTQIEDESFSYQIYVDTVFDIVEKCKINTAEAESWLIVESGSFSLGKGADMEDPELVLFNIPENAPPCTIPYKIEVKYADNSPYVEGKVYLTIEPR